MTVSERSEVSSLESTAIRETPDSEESSHRPILEESNLSAMTPPEEAATTATSAAIKLDNATTAADRRRRSLSSLEVPADEAVHMHHQQPLTRLFSEASTTGGAGASLPSESSEQSAPLAIRLAGAVANLCSATLGAGILALPFALYEAGLIFGLILLLASGWGTAASIHLIALACDYHRVSTYEAVVEKVLGKTWRQAVEISILIFCGGTAVAYVIAVGDILERVEYLHHTKLAMSLVWLMAMLPLSCLRRMQSLQCASTVGIFSIATLLLAATVHVFLPPDDLYDAIVGLDTPSNMVGVQDLRLFLWPNHGWISILRACPMFFFAYSCQVNVAPIYDELPGRRGLLRGVDSRVQRMKWVAWTSVGLCTLLYASISIVTLLDFGEKVQPNILSCYRFGGPESALLHLAFLAMAVAVVMAFPLNVFPARTSILQMWEATSKKRNSNSMMICINGGEEAAQQPLLQKIDTGDVADGNCDHDSMERGGDPLRQLPDRIIGELTQQSTITDDGMMGPDEELDLPEFKFGSHIFGTMLVAGPALGLALVLPNISVVFGLLGGTTSSLLGFVVPGLLGLEMDGRDKTAWILVVAGTIVGVLTTGVTVYATILDAI